MCSLQIQFFTDFSFDICMIDHFTLNVNSMSAVKRQYKTRTDVIGYTVNNTLEIKTKKTKHGPIVILIKSYLEHIYAPFFLIQIHV